MDRGTKIYAIFIAAIAIIITFNLLYESPKVSELNQRLKKIPEIINFPYQFRVIKVDGTVATMNTPRSAEVPVSKILHLLFPEVSKMSPQSELFQKTQKKLAIVQTLARDTVLKDPSIKHIKWQLDNDWLFQHGIIVPN